MKLREEEFYEQYHQHGGTTIIPTEIFNELYDDATEEIERLNNILFKREKKWEKWTTEKGILSTKMSEYLCKYHNLKKEYSKLVEINTNRKKEIERQKEIIRQLDIKNLELTTIINKLEEYMRSDDGWDVENILNYLQELKGSDKE